MWKEEERIGEERQGEEMLVLDVCNGKSFTRCLWWKGEEGI